MHTWAGSLWLLLFCLILFDAPSRITSTTKTNVELYQTDFEFGTYHIDTAGTYTLMEDITFDFNSNYLEPNDVGAWWPTQDEQTQYNNKEELSTFGYSAGISIKTNNVVVDLNGYQLKMSKGFYLQQKYFANIAVESHATVL